MNVRNYTGAGPTAPPAVVNADGDCFLTGKIAITVRKK